MKVLKWFAVIGGFLAGLSVFYLNHKKKEAEKNEAMDEYLMGSTSSENPNPTPLTPGENEMAADILGWKSLPEDYSPVTISFGFKESKMASSFQLFLSQNGYSSFLDSNNLVVDVIYNEDFTQSNLESFVSTLKTACKDYSAQYQGFHFE